MKRAELEELVGLDMSATYSVDSMPGIAFRVLGPTWTTVERESCAVHDDALDDCDDECQRDVDSEEVPSETLVRVMMVGDDRPFDVDRDELTKLSEDASCTECGQIGCTADGREP